MNDDAIMTDAAKVKCNLILNPFRPWDRLEYEEFCRAHGQFRTALESPVFWQRSENFRDSVFAHFCRNFVMVECANEEQQRTAARLFQQINEIYTHRTLQKISGDLDEDMHQKGFRYVGTFGGVKQYRHVEIPKPRTVKKRRRKS